MKKKAEESVAGQNKTNQTEQGEKAPITVIDRRHWVQEQKGEQIQAREPRLKPAYVEELENRLKEQEQRAQKTLAAYRSYEKEMARLKERLQRDKDKKIKQEKARIFEIFLEPLDNLQRSLDMAKQSKDIESLIHGLELVVKQFESACRSLGVKKMDPKGQPFDPQLHEAIGIKPVDSPELDNAVVDVFQAGYALDDITIRPARVMVGKYRQSADVD